MKKRRLSILLSIVMLFSLLPTTALAAGIPEASSVFVDGDKNFYNSTRLYYKNGNSADNFTGDENDYNAHYEPTTGTLTLKDYNGKGITVGGVGSTDITVVLVGTNIINDGSLENDVGGDITITSDSSGTLSITKTISDSNDAIGIETGLASSYTTGNVTIKGDARVTINMTHNGTTGYDNAYGIYAEENITISENASVDITCATPNNNTINGNNCNGLVANKNVTIDTNGTIKIDVTNAGGDDAYSYGIRPTNGATLTKVGEMEVKWKKHASISRYSGGTIAGSESFSETTHAVNVDETNCYASYRKGTPYTVTVENGTLTGPGVPNASGSGMFLENDTVNITPYERKGNSGEVIPFKGWTSEDVTLDSLATTGNNSFTVANKDVTVTATYNPFDGAPTFTPTGPTNTEGTLTFKTVVKPDGGNEYFRLVKDGEQNDESKYISFREDNSPSTSPYEYSYETRSLPGVNQVDEGDYYVVEKLNGTYYLSEKFTVNYTAAPTPTASVGDVTIDGVKGSLISNKEVKITLTNDKFRAITATTDVKGWFTNLPAGLDAKIKTAVNENDTAATIEISGTPSEASTAALAIKIPEANLVSNADLTVTSNENAVFAITTPITETLVSVGDLTGKTYNESAQEPTFVGSLIRDTDYTVSYAVKSGSTGALNSDGKPVGAGTYVVTVAGKGGYTGSFTKDFKIDKATPVYIAPTAKTGLAYTGSVLELITAGSVSKGGEMQYKLNSGAYSTTIPTATDAGNYTVHFKIVENNNYNAIAEKQVGTGAINIAQVEWGTPTETLTPVNPTTVDGNDGQITGTISAMQYKKSTDSSWKDCTGNVTGLTAGTYYVRYKADGNHTASDTNYKAVTLTDPSAVRYSVTVTGGTAEPTGDQAAGTEVTITATTKTGFNFKEWTGLTDGIYKTGFTKTSNPATFIMPASAVNVTATYEAAALTGTESITGNLKYGETLTADTTSIANNTGTLTYKWYRGSDEIIGATGSTYTLVAADIGKTITVKITSSAQTGEITGTTTGTIDKADGPAAPSVTPVACTNSSNNDGKITGVNTTMEYSVVSDFATKTPCTGSDITGLTNGTYYVRVAETTTHKAGTAATVIVSAYTASGTSGGGGGGYVPTTQKPDIKAGEGGSIALSKDGTTATITPNAGMMIDKVMLNGKDMGAVTVVKGIKTGDKLEVSFKQTAEEKAKMDKAVAEQVAKTGLTARSARTAKKNVKLVVKSDLKAITDAGYTVKYKFYRSTKKSAGYKAMKTGKSGIYINTYGKKGTMYYYKARVMIYDKEGNFVAQTALKQCKYASRLWTK